MILGDRMNAIRVVGTMFFQDKKLLIDKPRKRPTYQMIGGRVEEGETPLEAAIRECHEELGREAIFEESLLELIMEFDEIATSDGKTPIHFYVFQYQGELKGKMETSEEIESFKWYSTEDGLDILSNTLKNEVVPYCVNNKLID
jgi:8-oxo-dGTP pyrophosphatase MutT (NUDIX family)